MNIRDTVRVCMTAAGGLLAAAAVSASDHADPIDIFRTQRQEGGLTDLFVFPDGNQLVVILCARRALTDSNTLQLEPYTYAIHLDLTSTVSHDDEQMNYRYGGRVVTPADLDASTTIELHLGDDARISTTDLPTIRGPGLTVPGDRITLWRGPAADPPAVDPSHVNIWAGIADDPFIFPAFFETNVVAMVVTLPLDLLADQQDFIVWATSSRDGRQIDHIGRSLRTQNPRFELLNTRHPRDHAAAIREEHEHPGLMRDLLRRIGLDSLFAYRAWDQVPDVLLFTTRRDIVFAGGEAPTNGAARFPNGRRLEDDVAARLARYGDTLLLETSYLAGGWPRATVNDNGELQPDGRATTPPRTMFPYLAPPWPDREPTSPPVLSNASRVKLLLIAVVVVVLWLTTAWLLALRIEYRRRQRRFL